MLTVDLYIMVRESHFKANKGLIARNKNGRFPDWTYFYYRHCILRNVFLEMY